MKTIAFVTALWGAEVTWQSLESGIYRAAAVLTGLAVLVKFLVVPVFRFFRRIDRVITNVEDQLYPNGGTSLRDAVSQIQDHLGIEPKLPQDHDPERHERRTTHE